MTPVNAGVLLDRARGIVASRAVVHRREPSPIEALPSSWPPDLAALYTISDGLELADGTRILGGEEGTLATAWLKEEKSLDWDEDLRVIGERDDLVIVRDSDPLGSRAGGGVLEAPTDGLSSFRRVALGVLGYLEARTGVCRDPDPAPERAAAEAAAEGRAEALAAAIDRGFYPGAERELAHAALSLGRLCARADDAEQAIRAFARAVEARVRVVRRGGEAHEAAIAWRAAAMAAEEAGAPAIAEMCRARAGSRG